MYYIICIRSAFAGFCWLFLGFWRPRRFLYVLLLAFVCFSLVFLFFLRPRRFLYVFLLAFAGFSWVFGVRGDLAQQKPAKGRTRPNKAEHVKNIWVERVSKGGLSKLLF